MMKRKILSLRGKCTFIFLWMCFLILQGMSQTSLLVTYVDQSSRTFSVFDNGRLYFMDDNLVIVTGDGQSEDIPISSIRKINAVAKEPTSISETIAGNPVVIYPNPTRDYIRIDGLSTGKMDIQLYSLSGQLLLQGEYQQNDPIDISNLKPGLYLIRVNEKTFKISKL